MSVSSDSAASASAEAAKTYDCFAVEAKWRDHWLANASYAWNPNEPRENNFIIDTPPPYVSGKIHIGHAYSYTQTDVLARFMRMLGKNVFYPLGWDDNGLPTERQVEKQLGVSAATMPRHEFIELCNKVVSEHEVDYKYQFATLGLSVDWAQNYQTIGAHARRLSQLSVIDLYNKNQLYRRPQPTLWDPADQTALAQSEISEKETPGTMWTIKFALENGGEILIATTRPELIGADIAIVIHPDHPRAKELVGQHALSPLFNVPLPIIADDKADPEKGTGMAMVSTWGDVTDIEWWRKHNLPTRVILDKKGRVNDMAALGSADWPSRNLELARQTAAALQGLTAKQARAKMVELLQAAELIVSEQAVMRMVPCAERSGAPLEILETSQWQIRVIDKKQELIEFGRQIKWTPDFMRVRFEQWVEGLKWDWIISRQRYFGVPFPIWYSKRKGEEGKVLLADPADLPVDPLHDLPRGYTRDEVEAEMDVLDTWATSSLSPQISSHALTADLPGDLARHEKLFPAHMRPQGHDIIRTWAFYTIVKSYLHTQYVPWETIAVSGWCLAEDRSKMSKSKGNSIKPQDLIDEHGVDVLRYWAASCRLGQDTAFDRNAFKIGRKLQNKIWNAVRFATLQLQGFVPTVPTLAAASAAVTEPLDRWISTRLVATINEATKHFMAYGYSDALRVIEEFFWQDFCDNYLELIKARVADVANPAAQNSARITLYFVIEALLRLLAPIMPHLCEELFSTLYAAKYQAMGSVHARGFWPKADDYVADATALAAGAEIVQLLGLVRKAKSNANVSIKTPVQQLLIIGAPRALLGVADLAATANMPLPEFVASPPAGAPLVTSDDGALQAIIILAQGAAA